VNLIKTILATLLALFAAAAFAAVDVNKATQAELEGIKGIGPSMSAKILDARKTGAFKDWADMQSRVKGVRNGNSAKFSADGLTVNGAAFTAVATDAKPAKGSKSSSKAAK
jgi:competence protein ComEA